VPLVANKNTDYLSHLRGMGAENRQPPLQTPPHAHNHTAPITTRAQPKRSDQVDMRRYIEEAAAMRAQGHRLKACTFCKSNGEVYSLTFVHIFHYYFIKSITFNLNRPSTFTCRMRWRTPWTASRVLCYNAIRVPCVARAGSWRTPRSTVPCCRNAYVERCSQVRHMPSSQNTWWGIGFDSGLNKWDLSFLFAEL
jgi:hypothetical protein